MSVPFCCGFPKVVVVLVCVLESFACCSSMYFCWHSSAERDPTIMATSTQKPFLCFGKEAMALPREQSPSLRQAEEPARRCLPRKDTALDAENRVSGGLSRRFKTCKNLFEQFRLTAPLQDKFLFFLCSRFSPLTPFQVSDLKETKHGCFITYCIY